MIKILFIFYLILFTLPVSSSEQSFENWLKDFKKYALKKKIPVPAQSRRTHSQSQ